MGRVEALARRGAAQGEGCIDRRGISSNLASQGSRNHNSQIPGFKTTDQSMVVNHQSQITYRQSQWSIGYRARVKISCNSSMVRAMGLPLVLLAWEPFSTRVGTSLSWMP